MSQPETGALVTEYALSGGVDRTFGHLRRTGHEDDREVHLALNSGIPLVDPTGGFFFVFQTGEPVFRKYDAAGQLRLRTARPGARDRPARRHAADDVAEAADERGRAAAGARRPIRTAAVDRAGNLWIAFVVPYTYVYDRDGDKIAHRPVPRRRHHRARTACSSARTAASWSRRGCTSSRSVALGQLERERT